MWKQIFTLIWTCALAHFTTWIFLGLKWGWILRDGCKYNWEGTTSHTLWFLLIVSINQLAFFILIKGYRIAEQDSSV